MSQHLDELDTKELYVAKCFRVTLRSFLILARRGTVVEVCDVRPNIDVKQDSFAAALCPLRKEKENLTCVVYDH